MVFESNAICGFCGETLRYSLKYKEHFCINPQCKHHKPYLKKGKHETVKGTVQIRNSEGVS